MDGEDQYSDNELPTAISTSTEDFHISDDVSSPSDNESKLISSSTLPRFKGGALRAYESKRRKAYESKLTSSSLYWQAFRTLMHDSLVETQKAEALLRGWAHASETYGANMKCVGGWSVDERGAPVTDERKRKKILEALHNTAGDSNSRPKNDSLLVIAEEETCGAIIDRLGESAVSMAKKYNGMAKRLSLEILPELASLLDHLKSEIIFIEKLGDSIMKELEGAEEEVWKSWDRYYTNITQQSGELKHDRQPEADDEEEEQHTDVWVTEMRYRMAVAFLSSAWEKCSTELSRLFLSMKDTECNRRSQLKDFLTTATQEQEKLWLRLPSVIGPIQDELRDWPMERNMVENDVQASIRERAQAIQLGEAEHKKKEDDVDANPELSEIDDKEGNFELSSPLVSDQMRKAKVIEKRGAIMMSGWKITLAIVTTDAFLQVFELPANCKLQPGSAPEVAFQNLIPPIVVPSMDGVKSGVKFPSSRYWFDNLIPTESFSLRNCEVNLKEKAQFEIIETQLSSGASKMFTKTTNRKMTFRTVNYADAKDFVDLLKQSKANSP